VRQKRRCPALNRLIADAEARKIDCLPVWKLDRFGGSLVATSGSWRTTASGSSRSPKGWVRTSRIRRCGSCCMCWVRQQSLNGNGFGSGSSRPSSLQAGFREPQGGQDCPQPVRAEPATPPSQESVRPGRGTPVAAPRLVISPDCEVSGLRTGNDRPHAPAVFQKFVVGTWSRGGGQG
jgi:hypothetical protein